MTGAVLRMGDYRAVFVLPGLAGMAVFIASPGPTPRIAHERKFLVDAEAWAYARGLSDYFGCRIIAAPSARSCGEKVA